MKFTWKCGVCGRSGKNERGWDYHLSRNCRPMTELDFVFSESWRQDQEHYERLIERARS